MPAKVYREPATPFVAQFVGVTNAIYALPTATPSCSTAITTFVGGASGHPRGAAIRIVIRPEEIRSGPDRGQRLRRPAGDDPDAELGPVMRVRLTVRLDGDGQLLLRVDIPSREAERHTPGSRVGVELTASLPDRGAGLSGTGCGNGGARRVGARCRAVEEDGRQPRPADGHRHRQPGTAEQYEADKGVLAQAEGQRQAMAGRWSSRSRWRRRRPSRVWWTRRPRKSSPFGKKRGSAASPPPSRSASSLAAHAPTPSG